MINFYRCVVESILTNNIRVWFDSCSAADRRALQNVVKGCPEDHCIQSPIYGGHLQSTVSQESNKYHEGQCSPRCWTVQPTSIWKTRSRTTRLINSFFPQAVRLYNICGWSSPSFCTCVSSGPRDGYWTLRNGQTLHLMFRNCTFYVYYCTTLLFSND